MCLYKKASPGLSSSSSKVHWVNSSFCVFVFNSCVVLFGALQVPAAALNCLCGLQVVVYRRCHATGQSTRHGWRWDCILLLLTLTLMIDWLIDWLLLFFWTQSLLFVVILHDPSVLFVQSSVRFNCICLSAGNPLLHVSNGVFVCVGKNLKKQKLF